MCRLGNIASYLQLKWLRLVLLFPSLGMMVMMEIKGNLCVYTHTYVYISGLVSGVMLERILVELFHHGFPLSAASRI